MYGKIFASMYDGSLYGNWQAIVTMQQMIVLADRDGVVDMTPQAMAARTSIPLDVIAAGIAVLESPDQYSRSPDHDGRRIERLSEHRPWGWRLVNYLRYRALVNAEAVREQNRVRQQRKRERDCALQVTPSNAESRTVTPRTEISRQVEVDVDREEKKETPNLVVEGGAGGKKASPKINGTAQQPLVPVASPAAPPAPTALGTRLTIDSLPAEWRRFCGSERPDLNADRTFARFSDYWCAQPGVKGRKTDWTRTWRNWVRNEKRDTTPAAAPKPVQGRDYV